MGKKKDLKEAHAVKMKLPKKVGGVKVPKRLRHAGEELLEQYRGDAGRELLTAGLTVAVTAVAALAATDRKAGEGGRKLAAGEDPRNTLGAMLTAGVAAFRAEFAKPR